MNDDDVLLSSSIQVTYLESKLRELQEENEKLQELILVCKTALNATVKCIGTDVSGPELVGVLNLIERLKFKLEDFH